MATKKHTVTYEFAELEYCNTYDCLEAIQNLTKCIVVIFIIYCGSLLPVHTLWSYQAIISSSFINSVASFWLVGGGKVLLRGGQYMGRNGPKHTNLVIVIENLLRITDFRTEISNGGHWRARRRSEKRVHGPQAPHGYATVFHWCALENV